ncbi:MAG: SPFH domain-containing protein [Chloroflexota bacterium]
MNAFRMIAGFTLAFSALAAAVTGNWLVFGVIIAVAALTFGPWFVDKYVWVRIPAMNTGLVYHAETKAFRRFLLPGRHMLQPLEQVKKVVSIAPGFVSGNCSHAQTDGGVTVTAKWSFAYCLNPALIDADLRPNVANMLLQDMEPLFHTHINNCITHLFDQQTVATLCDHGARQRLERELRDLAAARLAPFGVQTYRVILKSIVLPPEVAAAVEACHRQELFAHSEARALERLHLAVSKFSEADMERLLKLRQLQELGQNGVSLHVPAYMVMSSQPQPTVDNWQPDSARKTNGRLQKSIAAD